MLSENTRVILTPGSSNIGLSRTAVTVSSDEDVIISLRYITSVDESQKPSSPGYGASPINPPPLVSEAPEPIFIPGIPANSEPPPNCPLAPKSK